MYVEVLGLSDHARKVRDDYENDQIVSGKVIRNYRDLLNNEELVPLPNWVIDRWYEAGNASYLPKGRDLEVFYPRTVKELSTILKIYDSPQTDKEKDYLDYMIDKIIREAYIVGKLMFHLRVVKQSLERFNPERLHEIVNRREEREYSHLTEADKQAADRELEELFIPKRGCVI